MIELIASYFTEIAVVTLILTLLAFCKEYLKPALYFGLIILIVISLSFWGSWSAVTGDNYIGAGRLRTIVASFLTFGVAAAIWLGLTELVRNFNLRLGFKAFAYLVVALLACLIFPIGALIIGCYVGHSCP